MNQVFWARKNELSHQTTVLTKTAGQQPGSGHCCLRSKWLLFMGHVSSQNKEKHVLATLMFKLSMQKGDAFSVTIQGYAVQNLTILKQIKQKTLWQGLLLCVAH